MSSRYKVHDDQLPHFVTSTVIGWVDALTRDLYKDIICESLVYCTEEKGLLLHAWVIMSNHIHLVVSAKDGYAISAIMRDFKKHTSKTILEAIENNIQESRRTWMLNMFGYAGRNNNSNKDFQFWQQDYHPVALDNAEKTQQKLTYLHENPVRAGIVWEAQHYKYSSAIDYYLDKPGLLPISRLIL
ncbi:MAG: transposase [Bacteroidetes bacterium]|nr:transposase [Bacteroidota bacterium]